MDSVIHVNVGERDVAFTSTRSSDAEVARILDRDSTEEGQERLWLDRRIHGPGDDFVGWKASGAVTTILTRDAGS